jgi:bifunctional DNA-binding transcriptional regulator/antitoxin component of YhaV-PrlF toxin-antitoxin module
MTTLTVTARDQVTFRKDVLQHLGVKPGERIELDLLPDGPVALRAIQQKASFRTLHGFLKEMDDAIAEAGAVSGAGE